MFNDLQIYAMHLTWFNHSQLAATGNEAGLDNSETGSKTESGRNTISRLDILLPPMTFLALYFKSCLNPLLYALLSENFRKCLSELWTTVRCCHLIPRAVHWSLLFILIIILTLLDAKHVLVILILKCECLLSMPSLNLSVILWLWH